MLLLPAPDIGRYLNRVTCADAIDFLRGLPTGSVQTLVTSPPYYGLRSYIDPEHPDKPREIGLEEAPAEYVAKLVAVFRESRRVLRDDGTIWINLGDSYSGGGFNPQPHSKYANGLKSTKRMDTHIEGLPPKSLIGVPWRVAFALQDDGWILRADVIWAKPNPMPESVTDRPTKAHEYVFLLSKQPRYYYDADAIREPAVYQEMRGTFRGGGTYTNGHSFNNSDVDKSPTDTGKRREVTEDRNKRSVWTVSTEPTPFAHFATFPTKLITPMILAGAPVGGVALDPFAGSGTTLLTARKLGRVGIGCDLNPEYVKLANDRLSEAYTLPMLEMFA